MRWDRAREASRAVALVERSARFEVRQGLTQLSSGGDPQLREHLPQVVLDGSGTDEELAADLRVGVPLGTEPCDLCLLWRKRVPRLDSPFACRFTGRQQLPTGALGERFGAHAVEHVARGPELPTGVAA